jgi:YHS domain-containing protein
MKTTVQIGRAMTRGAVALALIALASGGIVRANDNCCASKPYPLKKCVVSGHKLAKQEKSYEFTYQGQTIRLCCNQCLPEFERQPSQYLAKLERANKKAQRATADRDVSPALDDRPGGLAFAGW